MKVKELIEKLKEWDGELEVFVPDTDCSNFIEANEIIKLRKYQDNSPHKGPGYWEWRIEDYAKDFGYNTPMEETAILIYF